MLPPGEQEKGTSRTKTKQKLRLEMGHVTTFSFTRYFIKQVSDVPLTGCIFSRQLCNQVGLRFDLGAPVQGKTFGTLSYHSGFLSTSLDSSGMTQEIVSREKKNTRVSFAGKHLFCWKCSRAGDVVFEIRGADALQQSETSW